VGENDAIVLGQPPNASGGLPLVVNLAHRRCLFIGGGSVAARRIPMLLRLGANAAIVAPFLHPSLVDAVRSGVVQHSAREFQPGDTAGAFLTIAATNDHFVNRQVADEVLARGALVAVAHSPSLGNCAFMATASRGQVTVAIQTGGASPLVSAALRSRVESVLPESLETKLDLVSSIRAELKTVVESTSERGRRWRNVAQLGLLDRLLFGDDDEAARDLRRELGLDG
jgi:siroheme synthase-like protein